MARPSKTREWVREIALEALSRGEKPTQAMVRKVILDTHGVTASPNVVMEEMNILLVNSAGLNAKRFALPDLPAVVSEMFTAVWSSACSQANETVEDKLHQVEQREIAAEQSVLAIETKLAIEKTKVVSLQHDVQLADQAIQQKSKIIFELQSDVLETRTKLDAAIERHADLIADKIRGEAAATQRITEIEVNNRFEMERSRSEHEKTIEKLAIVHQQDAQAWDGMRKHLLVQTDQIRQSAKDRDEGQRAQIADLEIRSNMLTRKANDAQDAMSKMRGVVETLETQIAKLEAEDKIARATHIQLTRSEADRTANIRSWLAENSPELHQSYLKVFENGKN